MAAKVDDQKISRHQPAPQLQQPGLRLTARLHDEVAEFLASGKLFELVRALGSPLNVLLPDLLDANLAGFCETLKKHQLRGRVYFAHKSNRSDAIPRHLATTNSFIDVSSIHELRHALGSGFNASRIQATGPKNSDFLTLCLQHQIVISVDSLQELRELISLKGVLAGEERAQVLLRMSGFKNRQAKHQGKASRFGIRVDRVQEAFDMLATAEDKVILIGFSFHLDTVSALEKAIAMESCIQLIEEAIEQDFDPKVINIGGGFKVNYIESGSDWANYNTAMREAALGTRTAFTWQGNTFGLFPDKGILRGSFNSYSFYDSSAGPAFLNEILSHQIESTGGTIANFLRDNGIELWLEPGRALLDQVGITVARVNSLKESSTGDTLVALNMKRQDVCFLDQEIFLDPLVMYRDEKPLDGEETGVYFAGNLCLESDLVTRHKTFLTSLPEPGDLVVFVNTAGYFMDFSASEAIMQPIARKVAVSKDANCFNWCLDENYYPTLSRERNSK